MDQWIQESNIERMIIVKSRRCGVLQKNEFENCRAEPDAGAAARTDDRKSTEKQIETSTDDNSNRTMAAPTRRAAVARRRFVGATHADRGVLCGVSEFVCVEFCTGRRIAGL